MSTRLFLHISALLLIASLIAPSAFLIASQKAHAQVPVTDIAHIQVSSGSLAQDILSLVEETISSVANFATQINTYADWVNTYILQPAALIKSGNLMKAMTAGVIKFVTGAANGTGVSQFVQNLQGNLQRVGDTQALAFFAQYARNSNSPFAASISSSLRSNYLQRTSSAGFWGANRSTLNRYSPNVNSFLAGNWSQGGVGAWLALTTQNQNNPYTLYQASQAQLASVVAGATAERLSTLNWGQGIMSWCGANEGPEADPENVDPVLANEGGVSPGDPCRNKDGTAGTIKTPGSVISASLNKVLGGNQDKLVQMGRIAKDIGGIMNSLAGIWNTVQFAKEVLGGSDSGGLTGLGQNLSQNPYRDPNNLSTVYQGVATDPVVTSNISGMSDRITQYKLAWDTITVAANAASASLTSLVSSCTTQAAAAQTVLTTAIAPVLARAAIAATAITAARAAVQRVQTTPPPATIAADIQALQTMSPTASDVANAKNDATVSNLATASPTGSLTVSGGTLIDQMNLLSTNATALRAVCVPPATVI